MFVQMARKLQNRLALAQFKTKHGWENLTLVELEPKIDEQLRLQRPTSSGDMLSDTSSSSAYSDFHYPRALASSPMKGPIFSDAVQPSSGSSTGHRKRTYNHTFQAGNEFPASAHSVRKRFRQSPTRNADFFNPHTSWKDDHQLAQSSPIKPRKQHFTTHGGPDLSFCQTSNCIPEENFMSTSSEDDDLLPMHSFQMPPTMSRERHTSPPRTPPPVRARPLNRRANTDTCFNMNKSQQRVHAQSQQHGQGQEGADLLLYLATSPSPAYPSRNRFNDPSFNRMNTRSISHARDNSFTQNLIQSHSKTQKEINYRPNSHHQHNNSENDSANRESNHNTPSMMQPPRTPPSKNMALPSSMMTTPGGSSGLGFGIPTTPNGGQGWDFAEFVNITPSPAQKAWRTPRLSDTPRMGDSRTPRINGGSGMNGMGEGGFGAIKTPKTVVNRGQKFEEFMQPPVSCPMLGSRAAGSRVGGESGSELDR